MLFFVNPQSYVDPEDAYVEFKRREYVAALQEQQRRSQFQRELELEEQRHRLALASIAQQEAARRRQQQQQRRQSVPIFAFQQPSQPHQYSCGPTQQEGGCAGRRFCRQPAPEEILKRRQARQEEEERRARAFHEQVLSQIFGVAVDASEETRASTASQDKGKGRATDGPTQHAPATDKSKDAEAQPHWSAAPERARSLAEITSIHRTFASLRNTFVFPTGPLERLAGSQDDVPRLAYNAVNATIHAYDHALSELLTKLDGVESHGFKGVREARKQLVVKIEAELERIEKLVAERLAGAVSPVVTSSNATLPVEVHIPIEESASSSSSTITERAVHEEGVEKRAVEDVDTEAPTADTTEVAGYDFEPDEVTDSVPAPTTEVTESLIAEQAEDNSMEVEPTAAAAATVSDNDIPAEEAHEPKDVSTPVETSASVPASTAESHQPPTQSQPSPVVDAAPASTEPANEMAHKFPPTTVLDVSNTSDEESEVEDAIHVEISSEDDLAESDHDTFEMI